MNLPRRMVLVTLMGLSLIAPSPSATADVARPAITRLSVTTGPAAGGTTVRIIGRHFTRHTSVFFGGTRARSQFRNGHTLIAITPAHAPGAVAVRARTGHRKSRVTSKTHYTYAVPAPVLPPVAPRVVWATVSAADNHTCAIKTDRTLWCWGDNRYGQLGSTTNNGNDNPNPTPAEVGADKTWASVAAADTHTCATRIDGTLWCWGDNYYGQLANTTNNGTYAPNPTPAKVGTGMTWASVATEGFATCALRADGTLWCWGLNSSGQLGVGTNAGTFTPNPTPTQVGTGTWESLAVGNAHACATRTDHTLWCWGSNFYGELGNTANNGTPNPNPTPVQVGTGSSWTTVTAGYEHTCATRVDGTLWCWGYNYTGQLGSLTNSGTGSPNPTPVQVAIAGWSAPSANGTHTCATRVDGTLWCWGDNSYGQLGQTANVGSITANPTPLQVGGTWTRLSSGFLSTCAIRADGTLWCWGLNALGQLGNAANTGTNNPNPTPAEVPLGN